MAQVHLLQSQKKELEHQKAAAEAETASLNAKPSYPDINQLITLLVNSLKPKIAKLLASYDFASCLPTELKELPSKVTELTEEIKKLNKHVIELKNIQWELPAEFLALPHLVYLVQEKLKTLDSLLSLLKKVTNNLIRFATLVENASGATTMGVPLVDKATDSPAEGEKDADTNLKNELVDLLGIDIVTKEDGTAEVIGKFKASYLQLAEWREVVQACPDRKEKGCKTIFELIKTIMEYLEQTEKELVIQQTIPGHQRSTIHQVQHREEV
ncbi:hypothetical protein Tco_0417436 [Tanacetum coccineum]